MGCSEEDVKIDYNKKIRELKKQLKEFEKEKERYQNLYDKEYTTNMRLHQLEKNMTMEIEKLKDKIEAQNYRMLESQQDIIMALITQRDPRLDRKKLDIKQYSPKRIIA